MLFVPPCGVKVILAAGTSVVVVVVCSAMESLASICNGAAAAKPAAKTKNNKLTNNARMLQPNQCIIKRRKERRLGPGDTVVFPAGEVHRVRSVTRMVLYRVQAGADRHPEFVDAWPGRSA